MSTFCSCATGDFGFRDACPADRLHEHASGLTQCVLARARPFEWRPAQQPMLAVFLGPDAALMLAAPISAPIALELAKALGVWLLFLLLRAEFDNMRDGLVYGALVGLGFTWFEAALYVVNVYAKFGVAAFGLQLGARYALLRFLGDTQCSPPPSVRRWGSHFKLGAWLRVLRSHSGARPSYCSPYAQQRVRRSLRSRVSPQVSSPRKADSSPTSGLSSLCDGSFIQLTTFVPFLLIMALVVWRSGIWERRVIREELANEIGRSVTPEEYEEIVRVSHDADTSHRPGAPADFGGGRKRAARTRLP